MFAILRLYDIAITKLCFPAYKNKKSKKTVTNFMQRFLSQFVKILIFLVP